MRYKLGKMYVNLCIRLFCALVEAVLTKLARGERGIDAHHAIKVASDDIVYDSEWISMWLIPLVE